jgi:hypothetical protein
MSKDNYPSGWKSFDSFVQFHGYDGYGFKSEIGDVNRFAARYRMARSANGISLAGYSPEAENGYSGLLKVLLAWSAFENLLLILGEKQTSASKFIDVNDGILIAQKIRSLDDGDKFYRFIYDRVNNRHQTELDNYFNSDPCNPLYLASAIRHIFAHGPLTPHANEVNPMVVASICEALHEFILNIANHEFEKYIIRGNQVLAIQR